MNKQKLIEQIADKGIAEETVKMVIDAVDDKNWLRDPGMLIDPDNIKKSDRIRQELDSGTIIEFTVISDDASDYWVNDSRYFLLNTRPALPIEPGSVVKVYRNEEEDVWTRGKDGYWRSNNIMADDDKMKKFDWDILV